MEEGKKLMAEVKVKTILSRKISKSDPVFKYKMDIEVIKTLLKEEQQKNNKYYKVDYIIKGRFDAVSDLLELIDLYGENFREHIEKTQEERLKDIKPKYTVEEYLKSENPDNPPEDYDGDTCYNALYRGTMNFYRYN